MMVISNVSLLFFILIDSGQCFFRTKFRLTSADVDLLVVGSPELLVCARKCHRNFECEEFRVNVEGGCEATNDVVNEGRRVYTAVEKPEVCSEEMSGTLTTYEMTFRGQSKTVVCDGSWVVLQTRQHCVTSFDQNWQSYKDGFGNLATDLWLGNDLIHFLTSTPHRANFQLTTHDGQVRIASYETFLIGSELDNYKLEVGYIGRAKSRRTSFCVLASESNVEVGGHSGTANDGLAGMPNLNYRLNGARFSTPDRDNDGAKGACASFDGWWYNRCATARLNTPCPNQPGYKCGKAYWCIVWAGLTRGIPLNGSRIKIQKIK